METFAIIIDEELNMFIQKRVTIVDDKEMKVKTFVVENSLIRNTPSLVSKAKNYGIEEKEIIFALQEMSRKNHNNASFGMNKTFISSF